MSLDSESARKMGLIIEKMEELDDVQEVYHNVNLPEEDE